MEANDYTGHYDQESGYGVHQNVDGVVTYSDVLHPDTEYLEAIEAAEALASRLTPGQVLDQILKMLEGSEDPEGLMPELSLGRLIMADNGGMRTDLAVINHTHPVTHLGRRRLLSLDRIIPPSRRDVVYHADRAASNPGLVEGVQVSHPDMPGGIGLLLMRQSVGDALQRIQSMSTVNTVTLQRLAELGLSYTLLGIDQHTGRVRHGIRHLRRLYEPPIPLDLNELLQ